MTTFIQINDILSGPDDGHASAAQYSNSAATLNSGGLVLNNWFLRFNNFSVPLGQINSVKLRLTTANIIAAGQNVVFDVHGEKSLNPGQIASFADYQSRTQTTTSVQITLSEGAVNRILDFDITGVFNEIIGQPGFSNGQAIQFLLDYNSSSGSTAKQVYSFNTSQAQAAHLVIEYEQIDTLVKPLEYYLVPMIPETVFTARVDGAPTDPYVELNYDTGVTGSFGFPISGQTIWVGSESNSRDRGVLRLRESISATSGTMKIGESDDVGPLIQDNDYITIKNEFRLWPRYPRFLQAGTTVTIFEDYDLAYTNQTLLWRPVAVAGPPGVSFLEGGSAQIRFVGDKSYTLADGATISAYSWEARESVEGTSSSQGTEASPVIFTWNSPGRFLVSLTVTDSNGNSHVNYTWAVVIDPNNPGDVGFLDFDVTSDNFDFDQGGGETTYTVYGDASITQFPEDAMVLHVARGDVSSNNTWPFRDNVLFAGWILGDSIRQSPITGDVSFRAGTIDRIMKTTTVFPVSLTDKITPTDWTQGKNLTVDRFAYFMYRYRSTLSIMTSLIPVNWSGLIKRQDTGPSNLYGEINNNLMRSIAGGFGRLVSSHQGVLYHTIDYNVMTTTERAAISTGKTLSKGVWINDVNIEEMSEYTKPVRIVKSSGVLYPGEEAGDICPLFTESPGNAPRPYGNEQSFDRQIVISQADLNTRAGHAFVKLNHQFNPYRIQFIQDADFAIVPQQTFIAVIESGDNDRQLSFNGQLIPRRINRQYDHSNGIVAISIDFEPVSSGIAGQTVIVDCDPPKEEATTEPAPPVSTPVNDPSNALIAGTTGSSYYYQSGLETAWQRRVSGLQDPSQIGFLDLMPDPWTTFKQGYNPDNYIVWGAGKGFLVRTTDSGKNWSDRTAYLTPLPLSPPIADVEILRAQTDIFSEDRLYLLATWQETGTYRTAIAKTIDGFDYDWTYISGTQVRGFGLSVDQGTGQKLYVTTWEDVGSGTVYLRRYDTSTMALQNQISLGYGAEVDSNQYFAHPLNRLGQADELYLFGRMLEPQGFTGSSQILKSTDCGNTGSYSIVQGWGGSAAGALKVDENDNLYAIRQAGNWTVAPFANYGGSRFINDTGFAVFSSAYGLIIDGGSAANEQRVIRVDLSGPSFGSETNYDTSGNFPFINPSVAKVSTTQSFAVWFDDLSQVRAALIDDSNPPSVGNRTSTSVDALNHLSLVVLSSTRALAAGSSDLILYTFSGSTNTRQDTDNTPTGDIVGLGRLNDTDAVIVESTTPAKAYVINTTATTITTNGANSLTGINASGISAFKTIATLSSTSVVFTYYEVGVGLRAVVLNISGTTVTANTPTTLDPVTVARINIVDFGNGTTFGVAYNEAATDNIKFRTITVNGGSITDNGDETLVSSSGYEFKNGADYYDGNVFLPLVQIADDEGWYTVLSGGAGNAQFYQGLIPSFKFDVPFLTVKPRGLAVSGNEGIVAIGAGSPSFDPSVYAASPYITGIANDLSLPTGNVINALWWL